MEKASFENSLNTYVKIDDELKKVSDEAKKLKKNKIELESKINTYMVENEIGEHFCTDSSRIKIYTKKSTKNYFNRSGVYECAHNLFGSEKADALIAMIDEKKEINESTGLKRLGIP